MAYIPANFLILGVVYVLIVCFVSYCLLCGDIDCSHLGFLDRIHKFFTRDLFASVKLVSWMIYLLEKE